MTFQRSHVTSAQQVLLLGEVAVPTAGHPEGMQVAFTALTFLAETHNPQSLCDYEHSIRQTLSFWCRFAFCEKESHDADLRLLCS